GGGTVSVMIDGVRVGSPAGWTSRADLSALFPAASYTGINTALGVFSFDSRTMSDGLHTIAWAVTDNTNGAAGIGSRFFTVANGASTIAQASSTNSALALTAATESLSAAPAI